MKKVSIYKDGLLTNGSIFETQELADEWISRHIGMGTFGQPALYGEQEVLVQEEVRGPVDELVQEAVYDENGVELEPALYVNNPDGVISPAVYEMQTVMLQPAEYSIEVTDISAQIAQEKANAEAQAFLDSTDWKVIRHRDQQELGIATSLTGEEFQALLQERQMARAAIIK